VLDDIRFANETREAIDNQLNRKEDTVSVRDSSRMLSTVTSTLGTMTTFVMAIAGISLLVAAVSIFNVMLMSVTERIHEIGILRSIGTQKDEILRMFIYEAAILGFVGSAIGAICSLAMGYLVVLAIVGSTEYFFAWASISYIPMAMAVGDRGLPLLGRVPRMEGIEPRPHRGAQGGIIPRGAVDLTPHSGYEGKTFSVPEYLSYEASQEEEVWT
jgi:putative ABC transport system permease protein